ncbi:phosphonate ABC transporter, permease protein PhnE [Rhodospirillaceae bacterium SYSU D60014]|uniref:phosphonate ABC transporter, permease protein PhnE n=1 Tax=Virgifigura deserti TaxID=2268457 RepID=UPI000E668AC9
MAEPFVGPSAVAERGPAVPGRFDRPGIGTFLAYLLAIAFFVASIDGIGISVEDLVAGIPGIGRMIGQMFPPDLSRLDSIALALLETFQMALVGTVFGIVLSLPLAILATRSQTPHILLYGCSRALISLFRTVPDLVWALLFVIAVGLGPFAGALAIMIDTIGFCGRFFAEAMEEADHGPQEALTALGASRLGRVFCAVIPAALPSFIGASLFSLEKATRASVVLGLVGAGGIGIELKVAMDLFSYAQAATIILSIFLLVLVVERVSTFLRQRVI